MILVPRMTGLPIITLGFEVIRPVFGTNAPFFRSLALHGTRGMGVEDRVWRKSFAAAKVMAYAFDVPQPIIIPP